MTAVKDVEKAESIIDESERRLRELGYRQELKRELTSFNNFSVSFSIVSILTGLSSLYGFGLAAGGPAMVIWGWCIVVLMTSTVALSMAEICSAYPTSGGLYFWSARLAGPRWGPFVSWMTGWFNLLGQIACTAGIDFGLALTLSATISIATDFAYIAEPGVVVAMYIGILFIHGVFNTFAVRGIALLNIISVWWHIIGVIIIVVCVLVGAKQYQPASWVFGHFENHTGWDNSGYAALISLLMAQFTMTGYDASANMSEETKRADIAGPIGIIMAIVVSFVAGLFYLIGLTFSIQDYDSIINSKTGMPIAHLFLDTMGRTGAVLLLVIVMGAMFFSGNASLTSNSRTMYAFSRDKALPGSRFWHQIHPQWHSPVNAVWFWRPSAFEPGPFHLGRASRPIGIVACAWTAFITVLFILPSASPVTAENMNYASAAVAAVLIVYRNVCKADTASSS
ncbi:amino acid permease-domain-containing protein [Syncephalis fuscata]|nr:amino acid permease-domain-containing protein [Syncephalis fuscata]